MGGVCNIGVESTVVDARGNVPTLLRPGGVTKEMLGEVKLSDTHTGYISPGMMESHYAPDHPLRLNATDVKNNEALLAFGTPIPGALIEQNLSPTKNLEEAAANLFRMLRMLDGSGVKSIAVMTIPQDGLGAAINDRLQRAAAEK